MPSYFWVAAMVTAVVACVSAWFGLNLQPFPLNALRLQRQFATLTSPIMPKKVPTPFCFYKLSLQWPPAACNSGDMTCKPPIPKKFTIHGLWPQNSHDKPVPPYNQSNPCTSVEPTPAKNLSNELELILNDLNSVWPNLKDSRKNLKFWKQEWTKHGMCSDFPNRPRDYFNSTVLLRKYFNISVMELTPGSNYTVQQVAAAVQSAVGACPEIACNRDQVNKTLQLWEIRLCYKRTMPPKMVQNCPKSFSGECQSLTDNITFPN